MFVQDSHIGSQCLHDALHLILLLCTERLRLVVQFELLGVAALGELAAVEVHGPGAAEGEAGAARVLAALTHTRLSTVLVALSLGRDAV